MDQPLPTRSQLEGVEPFFSTFAGEAWTDDEQIVFETGVADPDLGARVSAREVHAYMERWLREYWNEVVDYAVHSEVLDEDPQEIHERPCPKTTGPVFQAHAKHRLLNDGEGREDYECPGLAAHPATAIGRLPSTTIVSVADAVPVEVAVILRGVEKVGKSAYPATSIPGFKEASIAAFEAERKADAARKAGAIDDSFGDPVLNATERVLEPPKTSTHRNTQVLRDMGHDL